ncbi:MULTISPECIES: TonB-dependent receptor [unclassified Sphingobium]|uniref:TonB-dependent receptor n=1 Tax=unclassified Sphingobium TaxID=2611147 RepID=UPI0022254692|nr:MULTISPECIES: TonB-dependent receptor [unclassified Sphingobium]MCW2393597.1 iron complex outermembrane receptor protein [Sphingobium sp. B8D3B]MCW2417110.1 iron complex outermembrane receptor protein [Sphingobium sp. B8D3C]
MRKFRFALLSSAIALISSTNAFAQDAAPQAGNTQAASDGDIIVTAQFREQNLQDTPIAITAVNSAMLEARSQTDISQVANQAPSVTLKPQGAAYGPALGANIRGVGQFDFNPALEPGVGFYVDDVYYATLTGSILDLLDLDRVEVLRGPQGTLAGRNSIGGAVKLYSQKPEGTNSGYVAAAYGSRNRIDLRGSADFNIAPGIDMRLAGVAKKQEGYVTRLDYGCVYPAGGTATLPTTAPLNGGSLMNPVGGIPARTSRADCVLGKEGEVNYIAARGQLRLRPSETIDINIIGDYTDDDRQAAGSVLLARTYPNGGLASPNFPLAPNPPYTTGTPPSGAVPRDIQPFAAVVPYDTRFVCGPYCNYATYDMPADGPYRASSGNGRVRFKGWGVSGQIDWEIAPNLQINSITAYREYESNFSNDNDVSPLAHSLGYGPLTFRFFSQELRLNGSINDQIDFTLGGYYSDQKSVYTSFQDLRSSALQFQQSDPVNADSKAAFAHISWNPVDALTLTGGIRYTEEAKTYTYVRQRPYLDPTSVTANGVLPLNGTVGNYSGNRVDYRANVQYAFSNDVMAYAQFSTGFKGGGVNPRPFFVQQALSFGPETLNAYEIGLKTDLFDRVLRFNVAAFLSKYKDIQLSLGNCTAITGAGFGAPCALPVNAGDADIKGVEVEVTLRPTEGMSIDGALSYIDFEYKKFGTYTAGTSTVSVGGPTNLSGPQFGDYAPYTPEWKWSLGVQYKIDLGTAGSLTPRVDGSYQSKVYTVSANRSSNRIDAYGVANARLTWRNADEDLDVSFEVTNLFDEYYLLTIYDQTVGSQGYSNGQPGRPREWAVSVKKKF